MMQEKKPTIAEANRAYFQALANTRGSIAMLPALAGPTIVVLFAANVGPLNAPSAFEGYGVLSSLSAINVVLIWTSAICLLLSVLLKGVSYRAQVLSSMVMAGMAVILVYCLCLLALAIATLSQARGEQFYATLFSTVGIITVVIVAGSTSVHVLLLRRRLRIGHSEKRTMGNFLAVSRSNRSTMFWIAFGLVAVVSNVVTSGQYLVNTAGALGLLLFACVIPSLPVEFAYLAYLKSKDRDYWERPPRPVAKEVRLRLARKIILWVVGVAGALALFWVLAKYVL